MKKVLLTLGLTLLLITPCFAQVDGDFDKIEVIQDIAVYRLDTVRLLAFTETAEISFRGGYMDAGVFISVPRKGIKVLFINVADNPETPEDETSTKFTQFINYIQTQIAGGKTLKKAITDACKIEIGL